MGAGLLALELLALALVRLVVTGALIEKMNMSVAIDVLLGAVDYVNLGQIFAVVTFGLREHAALFVVLEPLLKLVGVLIEAHVGALILIALCKEANAVATAHYPPQASSPAIVLLVLVIFLSVTVHPQHVLLQVVLLLF